jgi:hypothetical protein
MFACGDSDTGAGGAGGDGGAQSSTTKATGATGAQTTGSQSTGTQSTSQSTGTQSTTDAASSAASTTGGGQSFSPDSIALCDAVNAYRATQGLAEIPVSVALMTVAETHVADLAAHPEIVTGSCNLHSWSDAGGWTACCYTPDHAQAQCMWSKPAEITAGWGADAYTGNGFEIAASGAGTPQSALMLWQGSPPHHDVILNAGVWASYSPWPAMGCGLYNGYGAVWFGDQADSQTLQRGSSGPLFDALLGLIPRAASGDLTPLLG